MHATLTLQIAIRHITDNLHRYGFDASILAVLIVADGHLVTMLLGISLIHAHEHLRPVLCLRTTCTCIDFQHSIHIVRFALQHVLHLQVFNEHQGFCIVVIHLLFCGHLLLIEIECHLCIVCRCLHLVVAVNPPLQGLHLFHLCLGSLLVIPKSWCLCAQFLLFHLYQFLVYLQVTVQRLCSILNVFQLFCCNHMSLNFVCKGTKKK